MAKRKRSVQRGSPATTRAEREHQVDAIVERGKRLQRRAEELDGVKTSHKKSPARRRKPS